MIQTEHEQSLIVRIYIQNIFLNTVTMTTNHSDILGSFEAILHRRRKHLSAYKLLDIEMFLLRRFDLYPGVSKGNRLRGDIIRMSYID